jgi:hypothetical protein
MMSISGSGGGSELDTASRVVAQMPTSGMGHSRRFDALRATSALPPSTDIFRSARQVRFVPQPDSSARQVRTFRDLFLITELLDSKAESDDVVSKRSWLGCPVRSSGLSGLLKSSKEPPLIHQTEARLIRRYSGYLGRGRTHAAKAH